MWYFGDMDMWERADRAIWRVVAVIIVAEVLVIAYLAWKGVI